ARGLGRHGQDLRGRPGDEVVRGVRDLDRLPLPVGQHEAGRVEWRILAPPALPAVVGPRPRRRTELVAPHDLRAYRLTPGGGDRLVWTEVPLGHEVAPEPQFLEPVHELILGVTECGVGRLSLAGGVTVEGDYEVVDTQLGHAIPPGGDGAGAALSTSSC